MKTVLVGGSNAGRIVADDGRVEYRFPLPSQAALYETLKREGQGRLNVKIHEERYIRHCFEDGVCIYVWEYSDIRKPWSLLKSHMEKCIETEDALKEESSRYHKILVDTAIAFIGESAIFRPGIFEDLPKLAKKATGDQA